MVGTIGTAPLVGHALNASVGPGRSPVVTVSLTRRVRWHWVAASRAARRGLPVASPRHTGRRLRCDDSWSSSLQPLLCWHSPSPARWHTHRSRRAKVMVSGGFRPQGRVIAESSAPMRLVRHRSRWTFRRSSPAPGPDRRRCPSVNQGGRRQVLASEAAGTFVALVGAAGQRRPPVCIARGHPACRSRVSLRASHTSDAVG